MRLDELMRKFQTHGERAAVERVLNVARLGKRRAEMISRKPKVEPNKRAEKKSKSPIGFVFGWKRRMLFSIGWMFANKPPTFQEKFPQTESEV